MFWLFSCQTQKLIVINHCGIKTKRTSYLSRKQEWWQFDLMLCTKRGWKKWPPFILPFSYQPDMAFPCTMLTQHLLLLHNYNVSLKHLHRKRITNWPGRLVNLQQPPWTNEIVKNMFLLMSRFMMVLGCLKATMQYVLIIIQYTKDHEWLKTFIVDNPGMSGDINKTTVKTASISTFRTSTSTTSVGFTLSPILSLSWLYIVC